MLILYMPFVKHDLLSPNVATRFAVDFFYPKTYFHSVILFKLFRYEHYLLPNLPSQMYRVFNWGLTKLSRKVDFCVQLDLRFKEILRARGVLEGFADDLTCHRHWKVMNDSRVIVSVQFVTAPPLPPYITATSSGHHSHLLDGHSSDLYVVSSARTRPRSQASASYTRLSVSGYTTAVWHYRILTFLY